jgi:hypothetical protein
MSTELITLILKLVESGATWTTWLAVLALLMGAGAIMVCRERARCRTYREILGIIRPGTSILDQTKRRSRLSVISLPESPSSRVHGLDQIEGNVK